MNKKVKDENLIAYCGLYCGDCHGYTGIIPNLARDLIKKLNDLITARYDLFANFISKSGFGKDFENYDECYKVLGAMVKFRCRKGCRNGGGNPFCKIRNCTKKKEFEGCWECEDFETCKELEFLDNVHGAAHIKNLKNIKKKGKKEFIKGKTLWYHPNKNKKIN